MTRRPAGSEGRAHPPTSASGAAHAAAAAVIAPRGCAPSRDAASARPDRRLRDLACPRNVCGEQRADRRCLAAIPGGRTTGDVQLRRQERVGVHRRASIRASSPPRRDRSLPALLSSVALGAGGRNWIGHARAGLRHGRRARRPAGAAAGAFATNPAPARPSFQPRPRGQASPTAPVRGRVRDQRGDVVPVKERSPAARRSAAPMRAGTGARPPAAPRASSIIA